MGIDNDVLLPGKIILLEILYRGIVVIQELYSGKFCVEYKSIGFVADLLKQNLELYGDDVKGGVYVIALSRSHQSKECKSFYIVMNKTFWKLLCNEIKKSATPKTDAELRVLYLNLLNNRVIQAVLPAYCFNHFKGECPLAFPGMRVMYDDCRKCIDSELYLPTEVFVLDINKLAKCIGVNLKRFF